MKALIIALLLASAVHLMAAPAEMPVPTIGLESLKVVVHGGWGAGPGQFGCEPQEYVFGPERYAIDDDGSFVILDGVRNNRLQVFDWTGKFVRAVPVRGAAAVQVLSLDGQGHAYLTEDREIIEVTLSTGATCSLGSPPPLFGRIDALTVLHRPPPPPGAQNPPVRFVLEQPFGGLDGSEPWVQAYTEKLERWNGFRGSSPIVSGSVGPVYAVSAFTNTGAGATVTLKNWGYGEPDVIPEQVTLPERVSLVDRPRLLGALRYPPYCLYLLTGEPTHNRPSRIWLIVPHGKVVRMIDLANCPPPPWDAGSPNARFQIDAYGDLYVGWADPTKGFYISRLNTSALTGVTTRYGTGGPTPPP
jgi:hypothetical protein